MSNDNSNDKCNDKSIIKKLKDVNLFTIDELKELLGIKGSDTMGIIRSKFDELKICYRKLANNGFLDQAMNRILNDLDMNPDAEPELNNSPKQMNE